jgi:ATP-dependent Zn protease
MAACGMLGLKLHYNEYREYSEKRREQLEEAFLMIKEECYEKAKEIVNKNEALIKKLVPILIKRKSIEKNECEALIEELGGIILD